METANLISPDEFAQLKLASAANYKKLCQSLLKIKDNRVLLKAAICILKAHPEERLEFEQNVLEKATVELDFFKQLNDPKLHAKCCKIMTYRYYNKNEIVFREGDPSTEFFIIIDGSANVYVKKGLEKVEKEILKEKLELKSMPPSHRECHPSMVVENFVPPRVTQRRLTISFTAEDFYQLNNALKPIQKNTQNQFQLHDESNSEEVGIIRKLTHGLERIPDRGFLFSGGVFLHEFAISLNEGQMFGERGIMIESSRTGTVITTNPLHVAVLTKQEYKSLLEDNELEKIRKKIRILNKTFLKNLNYKETIEIQFLFEKVHFPLGHLVYKQGDTAKCLYLIMKGTVKVFKRAHRQVLPICELGSDQLFGEQEYFSERVRQNNIQITSNKFSAYMINYTDLGKIFSTHPSAEQILQSQCTFRQSVDRQRSQEQMKAHRKLSSFTSGNQQIKMPHSNMIYTSNSKDNPTPLSQMSNMEIIRNTGYQLKQMLNIQKEEQKKEKKETMTLAETLIQLDKQQQKFRKELRRQEQQRFSCIINYGDRSSSVSIVSKPKYQSVTEQMLFNCKSQQYEPIMIDNSINSPPQQQQQQQQSGILISSKHNLFRSKPRKPSLMFKYERKTPKSYSQELSMKI